MFCLFFASGVEVMAQNTITDNDTIMKVKVVEVDKGLILPTLKNPNLVCVQMKDAWKHWVETNRDHLTKFDFEDGALSYYSSITFEINYNGEVKGLVNKKWYSELDSICNRAFKEILEKTFWAVPTCQHKRQRKCKSSTVKTYFSIIGGQLQQINFTDLKTAQSIYRCF